MLYYTIYKIISIIKYELTMQYKFNVIDKLLSVGSINNYDKFMNIIW